jgi:uncharacterized YigZ family protein
MTSIIKKYLTIKKEYGPEEIKEKGSRFISHLYPVKTKEQADLIIRKLRKKYHDSTHVCFAYRLGEGREDYFRYNDDGEPSGTAGVPIYNEIKSKGYFNVLAAVVRYYGGTKLGTGGLARAYGGSAKKVIEISEKIIKYIKKEISISFPYNFTGEIMRIVNRYSLHIISRKNTAVGIEMKVAVPEALVAEVGKAILTESSGRIRIQEPD